MMKDMELEKQKKTVHEAVQTVLIVNDMESRFRLCIEFLKLLKLMPLTDEEILHFRKRYQLNSCVWCLAEMEMEKTDKERGKHDRGTD